jgi:hypothetical protein
MWKNKLKASLVHLTISALIVISFLIFVRSYWYPEPFFGISGLMAILVTIVVVDLILGPLLTFVVYKPQKPTLKFDLAVIAAIQIAALSYGAYTVYQAHPLYITYAIDRFSPINTSEVNPANAKFDELKKSKLTGPTLVYLQKPTDRAEMARITTELLSGKADLDARTEYYLPLHSKIDEILARSLNIDNYTKDPDNKAKLDIFLKKHGSNVTDYAFLPLVGKEKDVLWAFSRKTKKPVDIIEISPWSS